MDQVKRFEFSRQKLLRWCDLLFHTIKNGKKVLQKSAVEWSKFWQLNGSKIQHVKVKVSLHFLTFLSDKYIRFLCNISVFFLGRSEKAANYYSISFLTCVCISVNTEEEATPESRAEEPIERQQPRRRGHYLATYKEIFLSEDLVLLLFF